MTTASTTQPIEIAEKPAVTSRLASIDIFRGLTMALMIFVNDLASVHGLPWWNYHAEQRNTMTYPDVVFPFFLFIIGLSMPLSIRARLKKNPSMVSLWIHILLRSASLIVLGLILANAERGNPALMHMSPSLWALLGLGGASLYLSTYDGKERASKLHVALQVLGVVLVIAMYAIYRRTERDGSVGWINGSYPEILGLIGYTFFAVALLYVPTRKWLWAPLGWLAVLTTFNALCMAKIIQLPHHLPLYYWPFASGEFAAMTMAGIVASVIFLGDHKWKALGQKLSMTVIFALAMFVAGWLLTPLGISKIRGTPTWCLYSDGLAILSFALLYWICDVKKKTGWAWLVRPAGANTLLTYLLPDFFYFLMWLLGITYIDTHLSTGAVGVVRAVVFTIAMLLLAGVFTRMKIRLQL